MFDSIENPNHLSREESPERFLNILGEVTGMLPLDLLQRGASSDPTGQALQGKVYGLIVVGSCTRPDSKPKDIDIVAWTPKSGFITLEYLDHLREAFDMEYTKLTSTKSQLKISFGRLDVLGIVESRGISTEGLIAQTLDNVEPIIYAFDLESAQKILQDIQTLRTKL